MMASSREAAQDDSRMPPVLDDSITASDMAPGSHTVSEMETQRSLGVLKIQI